MFDVESIFGFLFFLLSRDLKFGGSIFDGNLKLWVIMIFSEYDRNKKCKILLNRKIVKSFEDVLNDIFDMLKYIVKELCILEGGKVC